MTNALYVTSLVVTGLIVVALAVALLTVLVLLARTSSALGGVIDGVRTIAQRVQPLERRFGTVNGDLAAVRDALREAVPEAEPAGDRTEQKAHARTVHG